MKTMLQKYCTSRKFDIAQFKGYEDLAELMLINGISHRESMRNFREILSWGNIPEHLRRVALESIASGARAVTKSTALKNYGKAAIKLCPWVIEANNPHYKCAAPMQLYYTALIEALLQEANGEKTKDNLRTA